MSACADVRKDKIFMVSAALTFLRTVPAQQAAIYNGYMPKASAVRQDVYSTGASKLAQISALVQDARNALRTLQDRANTAESQVRAAAVPQSSPDDLAVVEARKHDIRWAFEHGISLPGVCQQFVATGDRDGFTALHALLPWLVRASLVGRSESGPAQGMDTAAYKRALADAEEQIAGFERQVLSAAELAVLDELREVEHSMPWVRNNFAQLARFF